MSEVRSNKLIFVLAAVMVAVLLALLGLLLFGGAMLGLASPPVEQEPVARNTTEHAGTSPTHPGAAAGSDRESLASRSTLLHGVVRQESGEPWPSGTVRMRYLRFADWDEEVTLSERSTTTDAVGRFHFATGDAGSVAVELVGDDRVLLRRDLHVPRTRELELELAATPAKDPNPNGADAASITVMVFEPDGSPAKGVPVALFAGPNHLPREGETNARGQARFLGLAPGSYLATATSAKGSSAVAKSGVSYMDLNVFGGVATPLPKGEAIEIRLELARWARVAGKCVDESGDPLPAARVKLTGAGHAFVREVVADAAGKFDTRIHPGQAYQLKEAARSGFLVAHDDRAETFAALAPGGERVDHVVRCRRPVPVRLRFLDAKKQPIAGVVVVSSSPPGVSFSSNSRDYMIGVIEPERSDAEGRVEFLAWPGSYFFLFCHARGYLSQSIYFDIRGLDGKKYPAEVERELTLKAVPGGTIEGVVVDAAGRPVEGARVKAMVGTQRVHYMSGGHMSGYEPANAVTAISNEQGEFALSGIRAKAEYNLTCTATGHKVTQRAGVRVGQRLTIELQAPAEIRGRILLPSGAPVAGVFVTLSAARCLTDEAGRFVLKSAESGQRRLYVRGPAIYQKSFVIDDTAPRDHEITVTPRPRVVGQLLDPDGRPMALARIKLRLRKKWRSTSHELVTDDAGRYEFHWPGYQPDDSPRDVFVDHGSMPSAEWCQRLAAQFDPKNPPDRLQFRVGKKLTVRVLGVDGRPIQEMFLSVANDMGRVSAQDAAGRYRLSALPTKQVRVFLHGSYQTAKGARFVDLVVGEPERTITARKRPGEK